MSNTARKTRSVGSRNPEEEKTCNKSSRQMTTEFLLRPTKVEGSSAEARKNLNGFKGLLSQSTNYIKTAHQRKRITMQYSGNVVHNVEQKNYAKNLRANETKSENNLFQKSYFSPSFTVPTIHGPLPNVDTVKLSDQSCLNPFKFKQQERKNGELNNCKFQTVGLKKKNETKKLSSDLQTVEKFFDEDQVYNCIKKKDSLHQHRNNQSSTSCKEKNKHDNIETYTNFSTSKREKICEPFCKIKDNEETVKKQNAVYEKLKIGDVFFPSHQCNNRTRRRSPEIAPSLHKVVFLHNFQPNAKNKSYVKQQIDKRTFYSSASSLRPYSIFGHYNRKNSIPRTSLGPVKSKLNLSQDSRDESESKKNKKASFDPNASEETQKANTSTNKTSAAKSQESTDSKSLSQSGTLQNKILTALQRTGMHYQDADDEGSSQVNTPVGSEQSLLPANHNLVRKSIEKEDEDMENLKTNKRKKRFQSRERRKTIELQLHDSSSQILNERKPRKKRRKRRRPRNSPERSAREAISVGSEGDDEREDDDSAE